MYKFIKRITDILIASLALIILAPVLVIIILLLLITGEHEVFFLQNRVGYKNKPFKIWKFASMLKNSPNLGTGEITLRDDPRVTRFGKFLRITKLNEIPQIINVLKGDMSIVGPRPLMPISFEQYPGQVKDVIYNFKPGMTGMGSLIFRDEEKLVSAAEDPRKMYTAIFSYKWTLELWYQKNASLLTDFKIISLTACAIFIPGKKIIFSFFKGLPQQPI